MTDAAVAGMSAGARRILHEAAARAGDGLAALAGGGAASQLFVPGRIEVLGKHTDYAGGQSLTCAAERGFSVAFRPRGDRLVRLLDANDGRRVDFPAEADIEPAAGHWSNYPMTVARRLARDFGPLERGVDIAFSNTLPRAAGLSTSSALVTAVALVLVEVNELRTRSAFPSAIADDLHLAGYLGSIENGRAFATLAGDHGVGTSGGSEDHTAILLSTADQLTCYRYFPVTRLRQVSLPAEYAFVVAASGIAADKTGTARAPYNRVSALVAELLARWRAATGRADETLAEAIDAAPDAVSRLRGIAAKATDGPALVARLEHFLVEDRQILPAALEALAASRLDAFGSLVDRSQHAAETLLGNQVRETATLARLARERGARAASSFGAGFGGSVWALVEARRAEAFAGEWLDGYRECHPAAAARATSFVTRPGPGAGSTWS